MIDSLMHFLDYHFPEAIIPNIITSIGITNSIITFVFTTILQKSSMISWGKCAWIAFTLLWTSIVLCIIDLLKIVPYPLGSHLCLKLGLINWSIGVVFLVVLLYQIFSLYSTKRISLTSRILGYKRSIKPFEKKDIKKFGVPFLDYLTKYWFHSTMKLHFPLLLISDRTRLGLMIAQHFFCKGIANQEGGVYITFTRPYWTILKQCTKILQKDQGISERIIIIDCFSLLYGIDNKIDSKGCKIYYCDPRDPHSVFKTIKKAILKLQKRGSTSVRVIYDSLSDFFTITDQDLIKYYLRRSIVWEENKGVDSIYIIWSQVLKPPLDEHYLAWFGNSVIWVKEEANNFHGMIEGIGNKKINFIFNEKMEITNMQLFQLNEDKIRILAEILKEMEYKPDNFTTLKPFPRDNHRSLHFIFFLTAIDYNLHEKDHRYEATINNQLFHGSDLMYKLAMDAIKKEPDLFLPQCMVKITDDKLIEILSPTKEVYPSHISERAFLLRDAANVLNYKYGRDLNNLFDKARYYLINGDDGIIKSLKDFRAYEDPLEKKTFLLIKLLRRINLIEIKDPENLNVPVDHVLFTIALRSGLIMGNDYISEKICNNIMLSEDELYQLREVTQKAFAKVAMYSKINVDIFDDLLWSYGRECQKFPAGFNDFDKIKIKSDSQIINLNIRNRFLAFINGISNNPFDDVRMYPIPKYEDTWYF